MMEILHSLKNKPTDLFISRPLNQSQRTAEVEMKECLYICNITGSLPALFFFFSFLNAGLCAVHVSGHIQ